MNFDLTVVITTDCPHTATAEQSVSRWIIFTERFLVFIIFMAALSLRLSDNVSDTDKNVPVHSQSAELLTFTDSKKRFKIAQYRTEISSTSEKVSQNVLSVTTITAESASASGCFNN